VLVKAGLFLTAGAMAMLTGSELFARSGGIWRARPWFSLLFLIPALSLAGMPPFSGFWGKLIIVRASLEYEGYVLAFAALATGLLTLFAMARIWSAVFWTPHPAGPRAITAHLSGPTVVPLIALALLVILVGVNAGVFVDLATEVGAQILDPSAYVAAVLGVAP
jgi:multicomponent Na+:H+ antiporter subunit D